MHRCINRSALSCLLSLAITRVYFRQVEPSPPQGLDVSNIVRRLSSAGHIVCHPRITREVEIDVLLRFVSTSTQLLAQPEGGHTVNQTKVNRFGLAPLVSGHRIDPYAEHLCCGRTVHIEPFCKSSQQSSVL